jgi:DNA polymerase III delta prime subunit
VPEITQPQPEDSNDDLKVLILENADYMTQATTKLVMQVIDKCSESIRFVMLTNSVCGIEERLKSRVMAFPVPSPPQRQIELFLGKIAKTKVCVVWKHAGTGYII